MRSLHGSVLLFTIAVVRSIATPSFPQDFEDGAVVTDLRARCARVEGHLLTFSVWESFAGKDLNGDDDLEDTVLHVRDLSTGETHNLELATDCVSSVTPLALAVDVAEWDQGRDLNGDGDLDDFVLHVHHFSSDKTVNTGISGAMSLHLASSDWLVFRVYEGSSGTDLNGDGDSEDFVVHTYHLSTADSTRNLELASEWNPALEGYRTSREWLVIEVPEEGQGKDLNGDKDTLDHVEYLHNLATGTSRNLGARRALLREDVLAYSVFESFAGEDLNTDGDQDDTVVHVEELLTGKSRNLELAGLPEVIVSPEWLVVSVSEQFQGEVLNDDGDFEDSVLHTVEVSTGQARNLGLAANGIKASEDWLWFAVSESAQQMDLNADGDTDDAVFHVHDLGAQTTRNLGLAAEQSPFDGVAMPRGEIVGDTLVLEVPEEKQGEDFNGDGDMVDYVLHVSELQTGISSSLGFAGPFLSLGPQRLPQPTFAVTSNGLGFWVDEESHGGDLNKDGDLEDQFLYLHDLETDQTNTIDLPLRGRDLILLFRFWPRFTSGRRVALPVAERLIESDVNGDGDLGADQNGDGVVDEHESDLALYVHDLERDETTDLIPDFDIDYCLHVFFCPGGEWPEVLFSERWLIYVNPDAVYVYDTQNEAATRLDLQADSIDLSGHWLATIGGPDSTSHLVDLTRLHELPRAFRRGDCNGDDEVDISDAIFNLDFQFLGGSAPGCSEACEVNSDAGNDLSDAVYLLSFLFLGGLPPEAPFPGCAADTDPARSLGCSTPPVTCSR